MKTDPSARKPVDADDGATRKPLLSRPRFDGVLLVCNQCEHRGSGPRKLTGSEVRSEMKRAAHGLPLRLRVVGCTCLGLCPKKAVAVSLAAAGAGPVLAAEVRSRKKARQAAQDLRQALVAAMPPAGP